MSRREQRQKGHLRNNATTIVSIVLCALAVFMLAAFFKMKERQKCRKKSLVKLDFVPSLKNYVEKVEERASSD